MKEIMSLSSEITEFEERGKNNFSEHVQELQKLFKRALSEGNVNHVSYLLETYFEKYTTEISNYEALNLLDEMEALFKVKGGQYLAQLYLKKGHIYYLLFDEDNLRKNYKLAISHGMEQNDFKTVAYAINNFGAAHFLISPPDIGWGISKTSLLLLKASKDYSEIDFLKIMFLHLEFSLLLNKNDYVKKIMESFEKNLSLEENARTSIQFLYFKSLLKEKEKAYLEALKSYQMILRKCIETKQKRDLLEVAFLGIIRMNEMLYRNSGEINSEIQSQYDRFMDKKEREMVLVQKYLSRKSEEYQANLPHYFGISRKAFRKKAQQLLAVWEDVGHTLMLIDLFLREVDKELQIEFLTEINDTIQQQFQGEICCFTLYDETTLAYVITLPEAIVDEKSRSAFRQIREKWSKETSMLESIYYASVNNKENGHHSFEKCSQLVNAYIYSEIFK